MAADHLEQLASNLFDAYGEGDLDMMRSLLAEDLVAYITNAEAGVDRVHGREGFMCGCPISRAPT